MFMNQVFRFLLFLFKQTPILMRYCVIVCVFVSFGNTATLAEERLQGRVVQQQVQSEDSLLKRLALARDTTRVSILNSLSWIYRGTDFSKAMRYAQQGALDVATLGYPRVRAENNNYLGLIYRNLGNYTKAMECFEEARRIAKEQGYKREEGYALNNIGDIYKYQGRYDEARKFVLLSVGIFEQLHDSIGLYYCQIRFGEIAQRLNDYPTALHAFRQSLLYSQVFDKMVWKATVFNCLGEIYRLQGSYSEALGAFFPALAIASAMPDDEEEQVLILLQIGKTYLVMNNRDSAQYYFLHCFDLAEHIGSKLYLRESSKALVEIYTAKRDYPTALHFQSIQTTISDSFFSEVGKREAERMATNYELEKQQIVLDARQKQERFISLAVIVCLLFLLIIAGLLSRNVRSVRRSNAEIMRQQRILADQSTEIEITNVTLQEQNEKLATLNTEKTELMEIVAHDLKNPIGAVRGFAELMQSGAVPLTGILDSAAQIETIANRMLALVTNLLDVSHLESGGVQFQMVDFNVSAIVEGIVDQYKAQATAKNITVHYSNEASFGYVCADERAMTNVVDNIISNAVKYSLSGKNIRVRITNEVLEGKGNDDPKVGAVSKYVRIAVQDEGPGFSDEDMKRLFGKFARLSAQPTGGEHSTGLGLSIVKKTVEAMNGKVWCESEFGQGATFIIEFPSSLEATTTTMQI
jgi:signal transduction histidine kinase